MSDSPYIMRKGVSEMRDLRDGAFNTNLILQGAKTVFHVDGNAGNDGHDGFSWETSFKTLSFALAASQTDISSGAPGWAARNVILAKADAFDEDLVLLAQKTDVIGVGHYDQFPYAGLIGNHIPTGAANSGFGTRFFNFLFRANAAGGDIWTLDSTVASLGFYGCYFDANSSTAATGAIVATASKFLKVFGNQFLGAYTDAVIEFGAGETRGPQIVDNYIQGVNMGIDINGSTTSTPERFMIKGNSIFTTLAGINDAADLAYIQDNFVATLAAKGSGGDGAIVGDENLSGNNKISASDLANADWPALGSL